MAPNRAMLNDLPRSLMRELHALLWLLLRKTHVDEPCRLGTALALAQLCASSLTGNGIDALTSPSVDARMRCINKAMMSCDIHVNICCVACKLPASASTDAQY